MNQAEMEAMEENHELEEEDEMLHDEGIEYEGDEMMDENGEYPQFSFPSFSPTSRKRVRLRKPNFSEQCLELLIQLVNEHRDILYTKQAYTNEVHEKKIMVWTHITSQINAISSIPRTMEEVRKKWNDYSYYVKKKRELARRSIEKGIPYHNRQESAKIRDREDRVLVIVENAQLEAIVGNIVCGDSGNNHDNISSLLLDAAQRARKEANYGPSGSNQNHPSGGGGGGGGGGTVSSGGAGGIVEEASGSEGPTSRTSSPPVEKPPQPTPTGKKVRYPGVGSGNYPRHIKLPQPMSDMSGFSNGPAGYSKKYAQPHDVRRSGRIKTPVKNIYPGPQSPPGTGRGRGRGRGRPSLSSSQPMMHHGSDEDLVLVNRQRLAIERRRLNVEKSRLRLEKRRLEIEEERFKWQRQERAKLYPPSPQYEDAEEEGEGQEQREEISGPPSVIPLDTVNLKGEIEDVDDVCMPPPPQPTPQSPITVQPDHTPSSPLAQEAPSLTPIAETF